MNEAENIVIFIGDTSIFIGFSLEEQTIRASWFKGKCQLFNPKNTPGVSSFAAEMVCISKTYSEQC